MTYTVKEIFYTLQGEGAKTGKAAVFCRFSGCNLWTGREEDRSRAVCQFCDTDFVGVGPDGGRFASPGELARAIAHAWRGDSDQERLVVCTGGEPLLQIDEKLVDAIHEVTVTVTVTTRVKDQVAFLVEAKQGGIFEIRDVPAEQMEPLLGIVCPNIIYPYLRANLADLITRTGFPPIHLAEINFEAFFNQRKQAAATNDPQALVDGAGAPLQ